MSGLIGRNDGVFNPGKRFAWTNITQNDFTSHWDGQPIIVKAGQTIELNHHLANKLTDELVDQIMIGNAKLDEVTKNQPYYRSPMGSALGVPAARKVWEDQIVRELEVDEESPEIQVIRAEERARILEDMNKNKSSEPVSAPVLGSQLEEFAELGKIDDKGIIADKIPKKAGRPIKIKVIS